MTTVKIIREALRDIARSVQKPDHSYDLRGVEKAAAARFSLTAAEAKMLVRAWDRADRISPEEVARIFEQLEQKPSS